MPRLNPFLATMCVAAAVTPLRADLNNVQIFTGNVGLSIDAVGGADNPVGSIQAQIPKGATILSASLYSAGTPYPWYPNQSAPPSPTSLSDYNSAGITLGGVAVNNFTALVGATSDRADIGQWYTARADVTGLVNSLRRLGQSAYSWNVSEGLLNGRIDGEVLAIAYRDPTLPLGSVVLLDGGQRTGGETKIINFSSPLDPNAPGFKADLSLGISFSAGDNQRNIVNVNGARLTSSAGGYDDGALLDGALITAGGIGDSNNNPDPNSTDTDKDDELYSLTSFIHAGDPSLTMTTLNESGDDNLFFAALAFSEEVTAVVGAPDTGSTLPLLSAGIGALCFFRSRKIWLPS